jgi:hypothetical protein
MKVTKILAAAAVFSLATAGSALAFHSGGVGECEGCHSMHNSFEGAANVTGKSQYQSGPYLLKASDQSGSCLNCHNSADTVGSGYHISTDGTLVGQALQGPVELTPGGDFAWLKMTTTGKIRNTPTTWEGDRKGHNIIAADFGYNADKTLTTAPGGTYPAANLACSSCHDPHGRYRIDAAGNEATTGLPIFASGSYNNTAAPITGVSALGAYRILGGIGYQPKSLTGSFAFTSATPAAISPSTYNATTNITAAGVADRVAYGSGMSEWCANCHTAMHATTAYVSGTDGLVHPAGNNANLTATIAANYSAYVSSGVMTGTGAGYSALAPFELQVGKDAAGRAAMKAFQTAPVAPTTTNTVSCLSCHRAHASGFESMARYYLGNEFMTIADASNAASYDTSTTENKINMGLTVAQQQNAYNGRPASVFGPYARNYCNKCHAKD